MLILGALVLYLGLIAAVSSLSLNFTKPKEVHFRKKGRVAGTTGTAHLVFKGDLAAHSNQLSTLCDVVQAIERKFDLSSAESRLLTAMDHNCLTMRERLIQRKKVWYSNLDVKMESKSKTRRARATVTKMYDYDEELTAQSKVDTIDNLYQRTTVRNKRSILLGALAVAGIIAGASALFGLGQLKQMVERNAHNQEVNVQILQDHESRLTVDHRSIIAINNTLANVGLKVANLNKQQTLLEVIMEASNTLSGVADDLTRVDIGMTNLIHLQLSPEIVHADAMALAVKKLRTRLLVDGWDTMIYNMDEIFRCPVSHYVDDNDHLIVIVHIPISRQGTDMELYEYLRVPMVLAGSNVNPLSMVAFPESQFIAVSADGRKFKSFTTEELDACRTYSGIYFCGQTNIYRHKQTDCITAIYSARLDLVKQLCHWKFNMVQDFALQIGATDFLLYQVESAKIQLVCGKDHASDSINGLVQVHVPPKCTLYSSSFEMDGQENFTLVTDFIIGQTLNYHQIFEDLNLDVIDLKNSTDDLLETLHSLNIVGSKDGLSVDNIKARYQMQVANHHTTIGTVSTFGFLGILILLCGIWYVYRWWYNPKIIKPLDKYCRSNFWNFIYGRQRYIMTKAEAKVQFPNADAPDGAGRERVFDLELWRLRRELALVRAARIQIQDQLRDMDSDTQRSRVVLRHNDRRSVSSPALSADQGPIVKRPIPQEILPFPDEVVHSHREVPNDGGVYLEMVDMSQSREPSDDAYDIDDINASTTAIHNTC